MNPAVGERLMHLAVGKGELEWGRRARGWGGGDSPGRQTDSDAALGSLNLDL